MQGAGRPLAPPRAPRPHGASTNECRASSAMAGSLSNAANANNRPSAPIAPTTRQPRNDVAGAAGQGRTRVKPAGPFIPRASPEAAMEPEEKVHGATMGRPWFGRWSGVASPLMLPWAGWAGSEGDITERLRQGYRVTRGVCRCEGRACLMRCILRDLFRACRTGVRGIYLGQIYLLAELLTHSISRLTRRASDDPFQKSYR